MANNFTTSVSQPGPDSVATIATLAKQAALVQRVNERPFVVVPQGSEVVDLADIAERRPEPVAKYAVRFEDLASFIAYVVTFKCPGTRIFASETLALRAVIDYGTPGDPGRCEHNAWHTLAVSEEAARWRAISGTQQSQEQLADFLERSEALFATPNAATMREIVENLHVTADATYSKAIRQTNGSVQFENNNIVSGKAGKNGELEIPPQFVVQFPIFPGADSVPVVATLRYRLTGGRLTLSLEMRTLDRAIKEAFAEACALVANETGVPVWRGILS